MPRKPPPPEGLALQTLREVEGLSQEEAGRGAGLDRREVTELETGRKPLSPARLAAMAKALRFPPLAAEGLRRCLEWLYPAAPAAPPEDDEGAPGLSLAERRAVAGAALSLAGGIAQEIAASLLESRHRRDRAEAERLAGEMRAAPVPARRALLESAPAGIAWALAERLCAESERAAAADAGRALAWADLACRAAGRTAGGRAWRALVQGYATAFLGNALRVVGDLPGAEAAFARAWRAWLSGRPSVRTAGPCLLDESRLFDLEASLRRDQRRLPEALERLDRALALTAAPEGEARVLLKKAYTLEQMGDIRGALEALDEAEPRVAAAEDPRQLCVLRFNRGVNLCHLGRFDEAGALVPGLRRMAIQLANELDLVRVLWLEARVMAGRGLAAEALAGLEQVRRELAARGLHFDVALVALEEAKLHLGQGRTVETRRLAEEVGAVLHLLGVEREAREALELFREAARREAATLDLVERALTALHRSRPAARRPAALPFSRR